VHKNAVTAVRSQEQPPKSEGSPKNKLVDEHTHTKESLKNLIDLYEAWNKPEEVEKWRAKLPQTETAGQ
jgi:hypothetical protein